MIIDWRNPLTRGGSRWLSRGVLWAAIGVSTPIAIVEAEPISIVVAAQDRAVAVPSVSRSVIVPADDRTVAIEDE